MGTLRQIRIRRRIDELTAERSTLDAAAAMLAERRAAWTERENAAARALEEINENTSAEDRAAFEAEADEIEAEDAAITSEEEASAQRAAAIDNELTTLREELADIERRAATANRRSSGANNTTPTTEREGIAMGNINAEYRSRFEPFIERDEVRGFMNDIRAISRGVSNVKLTVPTVMLPVLRERIDKYSKLKNRVTVRPITGDGKQTIIGSAPEAVWTETTGKFNELSFDFAQITVDGNKVAGYVLIPNAYIEDSDIDLAALAIDMLGQSIGRALDKAIVYGTGTNMPVGILPRLLASTSPSWWDTNAPTFTNLSSTHVGKLSATSVTGIAAITEMLKVLKTVKPLYDCGTTDKTWIMSEDTWSDIKVEALGTNAAAAIVSGVDNTMPVIGGEVVTLDFMPAGVVCGGYLGHYLLGERHKVEMRKSEHVRFVEDQTAYAGVARYDGKPVAGEAFAAFSRTTTAVSGTAVSFETDSANATSSDAEET